MSIDYKVMEKGQPGVVGGGVKKFYAQIVNGKEATIDEIVDDIEKFSALSEADIRGVIIALENEIQNKLAQGRIVRLEKIGSLYPSISSKGEDTADKVSAASIKKVGVNYRAGTRILKSIKDAGFHKI
ncbi:DNA-binding protein [Marinifilum sp. N1E240]|uniref:HU family DNA-binding protein n=1 Tax=Marinifilum sp. N1E240 TaxID=2608082 RepID=UPI00128D6E63|nr:HU family DNA-binding protein [Marinifilum sp. N1E240]MPQ46199.1 DNA-binding protein [Marinifilum sp. N1E240]